MSSHTAPRFKVGDVVYKEARVNDSNGVIWPLRDIINTDINSNDFIDGIDIYNDHIPSATKSEMMEIINENAERLHVTVEPAVFGIIIDEPPLGTYIDRIIMYNREGVWEGPLPDNDFEIDIPGSGSIWCNHYCSPDNSKRKFFVKWINKDADIIYGNGGYEKLVELVDCWLSMSVGVPESRLCERIVCREQTGDLVHDIIFHDLLLQQLKKEKYRLKESSPEVTTLSLEPENQLHKAPNFVEILRKRVKQTKHRNAELVLQERLGLDTVTTNGIASMISNYC